MPELQEALPKFAQIANHIRDQILSGTLAPGDEILSERALASQWNVARPTAARAVQLLRSQGLVTSRQGASTVVADPGLLRTAQDRYRRSRAEGKIYPDEEWAEIKSAKLAKPPTHIAEALGLGSGERAGRRHRVILSDSGPLEVSTSWFTPDIVKVAPRLLERERIREGTVAYIERCVGRRARMAYDEIHARLATPSEARELQLELPAALLVVLHVVRDGRGKAMEAAEAFFPAGRRSVRQEYQLGD